jgi:hypothetical protein
MSKKNALLIIIVLVLSLIPGLVLAQSSNGSIRGTVYDDQNADGKCSGTGEPGLAGVPIKFVSGETTVFLESGQDGTYGLVAAGFSTWEVTAEPSSEWVVSSLNPVFVTIDETNSSAEGVDFCVAKTGAVPPVLPESGASIAPVFIMALATGGGFLIAGFALEMRRRRFN